MKIEREIQRIIAGVTKFTFQDGAAFLLKSPSRYHKYMAEEIYGEIYDSLTKDPDILTESQLFDYMLNNNLWSDEEEKLYKGLPDSIEELKVRMYQNSFKSSDVEKIRVVLNAARQDLERLTNKKYSLYHTCAEGSAAIEKNKYIVAASLYQNNECVLDKIDYSQINSGFIEEAVYLYKLNKLSDNDLRQLSKSSYWRYIWSAKKSGKLFEDSVLDMSDEQLILINWSMLYDNVYESSECPADDIVQDDDLLDGWLTIQKRNRQKDKLTKSAENIVMNEKIQDCGEVFVPVKNKKDFQKVNDLNDMDAKITKGQRLNYVKKKGKVLEAEMPDSKRKILQQFAAMRKEK